MTLTNPTTTTTTTTGTIRYAYESQLGLEVRVARIFNTFGPRMHPNDGRVVSNFIIQVGRLLGSGIVMVVEVVVVAVIGVTIFITIYFNRNSLHTYIFI